MHLDQSLVSLVHCLGMLHHDHCVGATRDHAARCNQARDARPHGLARHNAWGEDLRVQPQDLRRLPTCAESIAGADREAVNARPIEPRYVDLGDHWFRQHAVQAQVQGDGLEAQRTQSDMSVEARDSLIAIHHLEELILSSQAAQCGLNIIHGLSSVSVTRLKMASSKRYTDTDAPCAYPSFLSGTITNPSACAAAASPISE